MLRRAITRYGLISILLINVVVMQTAPLEATSTRVSAAIQPHTTTLCDYVVGSIFGPGIFGDLKILDNNGNPQPYSNGANAAAITVTQVLNGVPNGAVFTTTTTGFSPYTQGGAFYFSSSHTPGFNLQSGDDFILQFHDNSGTRPDLYYPNRLSKTAAMHLHLSLGGGAIGTPDHAPVCDMVDSYGSSSSDDVNAQGGALPVLYAGPLVGGRAVQRASFASTPSSIIQTLADSDIFNTSVQGIVGLAAAACPWNYIVGDVTNTPPLPDPRTISDTVTGCIRPKTGNGTYGTDREGYYIIGNLPVNKYVMLFGATGYQYQAYYYKDMTAPVALSDKDAIGFQITSTVATKIVPLPSGSPSGQRLFNAVLDGAAVIDGQVTDGRTTCGAGGGAGNSGSFGLGVEGTAVQAFDTNLLGSLVSQTNTDSSGNYTMIGLTPRHTYQLRFLPPYYNNRPCTTAETNSTEYVSGVTTTDSLSDTVLTTTVSFALTLGARLSGTISAVGATGFDSNSAIQVLVYDSALTTQPIYNQLLPVNANGTLNVSYNFPRLFQPTSQYKVQFSATGGTTNSYRSAWFSGALGVIPGGTGQQAASNATPVAGGAAGVNISLTTGLPLHGQILPPVGGDLSAANVSVQVNTYELDAGGPALVNSFFVQASSSTVISGGYAWVGPAVDPTKSYLVQYIPSPGTTTGFNPVFFASGQPLNSASNIVSATAIAFVNNVGPSQPGADVTLQLGAEIRVSVLNGNGFPFSGVKVTVLGTKPDHSCDTTNQIQSASSSSYDGTTDFLDIPAPPVGSIYYCVNFQPLGNVAGYLYGSSFSVPASSPVQLSAGQRQSIVVTLAAPGATIAGHLYSKDNSFTASDFGSWTIDVVDSNNGSTVLFSANLFGPDPTYNAVVTGTNSYSFNFNIPYGNNRPFVIRFNKPVAGTNYTTEYAGSLVNGHSPFSINQADIYSNIAQSLTVDGVFLAGAILTFNVADTNNNPLSAAPIRLRQDTPNGPLVFALSTSVTGTLISPLVTAGTYFAQADTPPGLPSYASLWYNQTDITHATPIVVTTGNDQTLTFNLTQLQGGGTPTPTATPTPTPTVTPTPTPTVTPTPVAGAGTVTGNVSISSNGVLVGLVGTTAQAYNLDNTLVANGSTPTDNNGNYVLTLPPGSYKIYFSNGSLNTAAWYNSTNPNGVPDFLSATQVGVAGNGSLTSNINLVFGQNGTPTPTPGPPPYIYYLPFLANNAGGFTTFLAFQNIGIGSAQVRLTYYNPQGTFLTLDSTCPTLATSGECIPINSPISSGNKGVGRITSSQPLNVIIAEATPFGGSAYAVSQGASSALIAPLAINNFFGGFITQLTVFNGGNTTATGTVKFFKDDGSPAPAGSTKTFSIAPQNTAMFDQSANDSGLPSGFNGWAQITGNTGSQLVAQVLEQKSASHFVAIANAQNGPHPSVYAPAIFRNAYGGFSTGSNIVNPNDTAVNVNITYYDLTGNGTQVSQFTLAAHAIASIFQGGSGGGVGLPPGNGLPEPYVGAAIVRATGNGVVMVVNELGGNTASGSAKSGVYSAAASGGSSVGLPVIARNGFGYTTGTTIFNTSNQTINGSLQYYDLTGAMKGAALAFTVGPFASKAFFQGDAVQGPPDQFYGTAIITQSSGPANALIITTNALSDSFFYSYTEPNQ